MYNNQPGNQPGNQPYGQPGMQPYGQPGMQPYGQPGMQPYGQPGMQPYGQPGMQPYGQSGMQPYGQPGMQPYGQPGMQPYGQPGMQEEVIQTVTTSYAPIVNSCFGRPVQLFNHYSKFLCGGSSSPHGHHDPNHGYNQSSYWFIEPHEGFSDKVRLRNTNGLYLCHVGGSPFCTMHPVASVSDVAWHMDVFPGFGEQAVLFRSHGGKFLGLDKHDHNVHCNSHFSGPHESQRFEVRYL